MNILFIGNSYTYFNDMPALFDKLCKANGKTVTVFSAACPGRVLYENLNPGDSYWAQIEEITAANHIDICFLQEHSIFPIIDFELFESGSQSIMKALNGRVSEYIFYATWGRKDGERFLTEKNMDSVSMGIALHEAYKRAAADLNAGLSPVGRHFAEIYKGDSGIELYMSDLSHPSLLGSCLAACVHYKTVFGELPSDMACLGLTGRETDAFKLALGKNF